MADDHDALLAEARAMLADQRYGSLTHAVILGLLIAAHLLEARHG
jgi:hypothetical protein